MVMTLLVMESVKVNVCDLTGTVTHEEPREKATLLTMGLLPFAEDAIPATRVSGDKLKSRTLALSPG